MQLRPFPPAGLWNPETSWSLSCSWYPWQGKAGFLWSKGGENRLHHLHQGLLLSHLYIWIKNKKRHISLQGCSQTSLLKHRAPCDNGHNTDVKNGTAICNCKIRDLIAPMIKGVKITLYNKMFQVPLCGSRQLLSVKLCNISITNATETRAASQLYNLAQDHNPVPICKLTVPLLMSQKC